MNGLKLNIDKIINLRAEMAQLKGFNNIRAQRNLYNRMLEHSNKMLKYLNEPTCPICYSIYSKGIIRSNINGSKCSKCFNRGRFVNLVHKKDVKNWRKEWLK